MTGMLRRRLPFGAGEVPQSLASRLARRHGLAAFPFCSELGMSFRKIIGGRPEALAELAEVAGVPQDLLLRNAFRDDDRFLVYREERLLGSQVRRHHMRFCPHCLRHDVAVGDGWRRGEASVYVRGPWLIEPIRTCPVHSTALVALEPSVGRDDLHDVAGRLAPILPALDRLTSGATVREPSSFETYLLGRFEGQRSSEWLDGLSLHAAIKACVGIGLTETRPDGGSMRKLTDDDWHLAESKGFDIAREGAGTIRGFLERVHSTDDLSERNQPRSWGKLHRLIRFFDLHNADESFRPAYEVIAEFMADRRAIEGSVLGVTVKRKLHSLNSASRAARMSPNALRSVLAAHDMLPDGHENMLPGSIMVDADRVADILASLAARWGERQVADYLKIPMHQVRLLASEQVIVGERMDGSRGFHLQVFDEAAVKRLVSDLVEDVEVLQDERVGCFGLGAVSDALGYPQAKLIRLLIERQLQAVGRLASEDGLQSLRLDLEEVKRRIPKRDLSRRETTQMLGISRHTIFRLKASGLLSARSVKTGVRSCSDFFSYQEVFAFSEKYISIHNHAVSLGTRQDTARRQLSGRGVKPALERETHGADFYLKSEVRD